MSAEREVPGVRPYHSPAGGWGALRATARAIREQMDVADGAKVLLDANKPDGFDCPGCAWPDKAHASTFQFCENGTKAVAWEATRKRATPEFFAAHTVAELAAWSDHALEDAGRLTHPMAYDRESDRYLPIPWDDAFARIGRLQMRAGLDPAEAFVAVTSRCSYEMVEKTAVAGVAMIVAISAPTTLAIRKATDAQMTLVAVARRDGHLVFTGGQRILGAARSGPDA